MIQPLVGGQLGAMVAQQNNQQINQLGESLGAIARGHKLEKQKKKERADQLIFDDLYKDGLVAMNIISGQGDDASKQQMLNNHLLGRKSRLEESGAADTLDTEELMAMPYGQQVAEISGMMQSIAKTDGQFKAFGQGGEPAKDTRTKTQKEYADAVNQGYKGSLLDYQKELKKSGATKVNTTINPETGRQDQTKSVASATQKDIISAQKALADLQVIADTHSDEFLTGWGRTKAAFGAVLDKYVDSDAGGLASFNAERTKFQNAAKQMFNQYRKEITGAAAGEREMKDLLDSMFNDSQGPREFKASFDLFMSKAQESLEMHQQNAKNGIDVEGENKTNEAKNKDDAQPNSYTSSGGIPYTVK